MAVHRYLQAKIENAREALYEEHRFVATKEEDDEDYQLLHEQLEEKVGKDDDDELDEKRKSG